MIKVDVQKLNEVHVMIIKTITWTLLIVSTISLDNGFFILST